MPPRPDLSLLSKTPSSSRPRRSTAWHTARPQRFPQANTTPLPTLPARPLQVSTLNTLPSSPTSLRDTSNPAHKLAMLLQDMLLPERSLHRLDIQPLLLHQFHRQATRPQLPRPAISHQHINLPQQPLLLATSPLLQLLRLDISLLLLLRLPTNPLRRLLQQSTSLL